MEPRPLPPEPGSQLPPGELTPLPEVTGSTVPTASPGSPPGQGQTAASSGARVRTAPGLIGPYELLEEVAQGGMGVVYRARHADIDRVVALKTLRDPSGGSTQLDRFDREIRAAARLTHPNIVPIYEVGHHEGVPYFTMAFVGGGSLARHRPRFQADPRAALALLEKVARAVHYAHQQGVVHRDLKPGNVLLDEQDEPHVADFGLAKLREADVELTQTGMVLGTPAYMAPEQAAGRAKEVGPATDVWALGVMLYELLAGRRPFLGDSAEEVKRQILTAEPPRLGRLRPHLGRDLEGVVHRCLVKDPDQRYPTAGALADDLRRCLEGKPPEAELKTGLLRRLTRPRGRRVRLLVLALLAGLLTAAVLFVLRDRPEKARPPAEDIQARLARGEEVVLIGDRGMPRYQRWPINNGDISDQVLKDGTCQVASIGQGLVELVPGPLPDRFQFEAEVRDLSGEGGKVGIFFGYRKHHLRDEAVHTFRKLIFNEQPNPYISVTPRSQAGLYLQLSADPGTPHKGLADHLTFANMDFPVRIGKHPWRKLKVEVTPGRIKSWLDNQELPELDRKDLAIPILKVTEERPDFDREGLYQSQGALGLYVSQGSAAFRRVVIKPLP